MQYLFSGLDFYTGLMLFLALIFVLLYEAINGFHDTANAVATVIYTRAMRPQFAVIMAGICNFFGVLLGGLSVAYAIVHLLPTNLLLNISSQQGLVMMFSILLAAIAWNFGTWYFGIPASSSHTLIGSIIGVGLANAALANSSIVEALNVSKMLGILLSLFISPITGMVVAGLLLWILRRYWNHTKKQQRMHLTPAEREKRDGKRKPPFWTRIMLIISAIGVSFSHGANDGQKGIGLLMLVLIGIAPAGFVVNMAASDYEITRTRDAVQNVADYYIKHQQRLAPIIGPPATTNTAFSNATECHTNEINRTIQQVQKLLEPIQRYDALSVDERIALRQRLMCIADAVTKVSKSMALPETEKKFLGKLRQDLLLTIEYAPLWIIIAVALALGLGTMVGWRRVATTIGEKIGRKGMTYAQGVSAQMTAALSIGVASYTGMPVSTTHVLSSAVAGTMLANGSGIQEKTIKTIVMAWVLTLPATIGLSGLLYVLGTKLF